MENRLRINKTYLFWVAIGIVAFSFLYYIRIAIRPFILSFILAYLFLPLVNKSERFSRGFMSGIIVVSIFISAIIIISILLPFILDRISSMSAGFISFTDVNNSLIANKISKILNIDDNIIIAIQNYLIKYLKFFIDRAFLHNSTNDFIVSILNAVLTFFVMPIITFYMLKDWPTIRNTFHEMLPKESKHTVINMMQQIDASIFSFLRGQLNVCLFFAMYYSLMFSIIGINFGFLLGMMLGILIFIPYIGFAIGMIICSVLIITQFGVGYEAMITIIVFIIGQIIDMNFTTPKFIGNKVGVHPIWIVFGLFVSSKILGIIGSIMAVPITTSFAIFVKFAINKYKNSYYYHK